MQREGVHDICLGLHEGTLERSRQTDGDVVSQKAQQIGPGYRVEGFPVH